MSRQLSCFFAREFFWSYLEDSLDKSRALELEEHLRECHDCGSLLQRERVSRKILQELAQVSPNPEVALFIHREHRFWDEAFEKFGLANSMETFKWVGQLSLVALALITTVHFFPWLNLARSLQNMRPTTPTLTTASKNTNTDEDEVAKAVTVAKTTTTLTEPPFIGPRLPTAEELAQSKKIAENSAAEEETTKEKENGQGDADHAAGLLWRGFLKVDDLNDEVAARVTKAVVDLGGRKAGQAELGRKREHEFYYHFILPEENYDTLLNDLNAEGLVQLTKERHPRVIKSGYMRIIMTVEQNEDETR